MARLSGRNRGKLSSVIAVAAVTAAVAAAPAPAIVPPTDCGPMEVSGKRYKIKADQLRCNQAREFALAYLQNGDRPRGYECVRMASPARSSSSAASRGSRSSSRSDGEASACADGSLWLALASRSVPGCGRRARPRTVWSSAPTCRSPSGCSRGPRRWCWSSPSSRSRCSGRRRGSSTRAGARCRSGSVERWDRRRWKRLCGAVGVALLAVVVVSGLAGVQSSFANFAPTFVFITFWVGMAFASVLFGGVFAAFSPWRALGRASGWALARGRTPRPIPSGSAAGPPPPACSPSPGSSLPRAGASSRGRWRSPCSATPRLTLTAQARLRSRRLEPAGRGVRRLLRPLRADLAVRAARRRRSACARRSAGCRGSIRSPERSRSSS